MANRYWVGGTANWDGTAGTKWATTSGGAGGAAVPTGSDNVFFDAASGAVTVTRATVLGSCLNCDFTGFTGTFAGSVTMSIWGNLTLSASMTLTYTGIFYFGRDGGTGFTLTTNGVSIPCTIQKDTAGTTLTLADNLTCTKNLELNNGTIDANNKNVTIRNFTTTAGTRTLTMGSGTWNLTGTITNVWDMSDVTNFTLNANTSTIKITDTSSVTLQFLGGGLTYNNLWWARGASTGTNTILDSNTFANLKDTGSVAHTDKFTDGTTTTITTMTVTGSVGNLITLNGSSTGGWTISCASGVISCDYLSITNSTATGGASFYAGANSTNGGSNSGWIFTAPPTVNTGAFFNFFN